MAQGGADLLEAARQRLLFWDMDPEDIAALERTGKVSRTVDLHAELPGYVIQKAAIHGMRVTPADTLFDIADLSRVWILADVYESDLPLVSVGMASEATLPYEPGRTWRGPVAYVDPLVDPATRTVKVRIDVANAGQTLKPDMFANVLLRRDLGQALFVPGERRARSRATASSSSSTTETGGSSRARSRRASASRAGTPSLSGLARGRARRDLRQLPDRLRVQPQGGDRRAWARAAPAARPADSQARPATPAQPRAAVVSDLPDAPGSARARHPAAARSAAWTSSTSGAAAHRRD